MDKQNSSALSEFVSGEGRGASQKNGSLSGALKFMGCRQRRVWRERRRGRRQTKAIGLASWISAFSPEDDGWGPSRVPRTGLCLLPQLLRSHPAPIFGRQLVSRPSQGWCPSLREGWSFCHRFICFPKIKMRTIRSCRGKNLVGKGTDGDGRPSGASNLP